MQGDPRRQGDIPGQRGVATPFGPAEIIVRTARRPQANQLVLIASDGAFHLSQRPQPRFQQMLGIRLQATDGALGAVDIDANFRFFCAGQFLDEFVIFRVGRLAALATDDIADFMQFFTQIVHQGMQGERELFFVAFLLLSSFLSSRSS